MTEPSRQPPPVDDELWSLVEILVTGTATAEERDRLDVRLRADPSARLFYVTYLDLHAQLQWSTRGASVPPRARGQQSRASLVYAGRLLARWGPAIAGALV